MEGSLIHHHGNISVTKKMVSIANDHEPYVRNHIPAQWWYKVISNNPAPSLSIPPFHPSLWQLPRNAKGTQANWNTAPKAPRKAVGETSLI